MLKNLFEEYQFFPQYPEKELIITAQLFGGIIEHGLVHNYMALGLALRFVLDALRKTHNSKMYYFGITALDRFKGKLKDFAKYCEHVAGIPHFREFPPHLTAVSVDFLKLLYFGVVFNVWFIGTFPWFELIIINNNYYYIQHKHYDREFYSADQTSPDFVLKVAQEHDSSPLQIAVRLVTFQCGC